MYSLLLLLSYPPQSLTQNTCTATAIATAVQAVWYNHTGEDIQYSQRYIHVKATEIMGVPPNSGVNVYVGCYTLTQYGICEEQYCKTQYLNPIVNTNISDVANENALTKLDYFQYRLCTTYDELVNLIKNDKGAGVLAVEWAFVAPKKIETYDINSLWIRLLGVPHSIALIDVNEDGYIIAVNPWHMPFTYYEISPQALQQMFDVNGAYGIWHQQ